MANFKTLTINDTGYLKFPSGTTSERPLEPSSGMVRYNTDLNCNEYYDGTQWIDVITGAPAVISNGLILNLDAGSLISYPGSENLWYDLTNSNNNGTLTNGVRYSNANGGSLVFDGVDDVVNGTIPGYTFTGDFTQSAWIYKLNNTQPWQGVFTNSSPATNNTYLMTFGNGSAEAPLNSVGANQVGVLANGIFLDIGTHTNRWLYIVMTKSGSTLRIYCYKDGSLLQTSGTITWNGGNFATTNNYQIGRHWANIGPGVEPLNGNVSQVLVYNRALTASEIEKNYDALKSRYIIPQTFNPINVPIVKDGLLTYLDAGISYSYPRTGTTWFDLSGTNNGTLVNATGFDSDNSGSLYFDAADNYIDLGSFFTYQTFTISVWVYPASTQVQYADIFDNNHTGFRSFVLQQDNLNTNQYSFGVNDASGNISIVYLTLPSNYWTNITFTFTPSDRVKCYINGQFFNQGITAGGRNVVYSSQSLRIGGWAAGGRHWNGRLSTFAIYNRVLSSSEVQQNFNAVRGRYQIQENSVPILTDGLALHLDAANPYSYSGTGSNWIDLSGNGRNFLWASAPSYTSSGNRSYFSTLNNRCTGPASNSFGITNTSGYTIFLIFEQNALTNASAFKFYGTAGRAIFAHAAWTDNNIYFDQGGCCASDTRTIAASAGTLTWNIFIFRRFTNSSTRTIGKNQNILATNTDAAATLDLDTRAVDLGSSDEYGGNLSTWNAKLNSFIVYNRGLTDEEVSQNVTLLSRRLGI